MSLDLNAISKQQTDKKIVMHSLRSSTISILAKNIVGDQEVIKLTAHSTTKSLK